MSKQLLFLVVCFFCHFLMGQGESDVFTMPSKMSLSKPVSSNTKEEPKKAEANQRSASAKEVTPAPTKDVPAKTTPTKEVTPAPTKDVPAKTTPTKEVTPVPAKTTPTKEVTPVPAKTTPTKEVSPAPAKDVPAKVTPAKTSVPSKGKTAATEKPYEMYVSLWEPGWKAGKASEEPTIAEYFMFKNGQNISNFTEMAGVTTYKEFFAKNVEQISGEFVEDMKPKYGKAKYTEVDKNVYGDNSYIVFMIETENYNNTGKPQSIIQHVIKGADYVHTCYYINVAKKMPATEKRKWENFFKKTSLQKMLPSAYLSMIGVEK